MEVQQHSEHGACNASQIVLNTSVDSYGFAAGQRYHPGGENLSQLLVLLTSNEVQTQSLNGTNSIRPCLAEEWSQLPPLLCHSSKSH